MKIPFYVPLAFYPSIQNSDLGLITFSLIIRGDDGYRVETLGD